MGIGLWPVVGVDSMDVEPERGGAMDGEISTTGPAPALVGSAITGWNEGATGGNSAVQSGRRLEGGATVGRRIAAAGTTSRIRDITAPDHLRDRDHRDEFRALAERVGVVGRLVL